MLELSTCTGWNICQQVSRNWEQKYFLGFKFMVLISFLRRHRICLIDRCIFQNSFLWASFFTQANVKKSAGRHFFVEVLEQEVFPCCSSILSLPTSLANVPLGCMDFLGKPAMAGHVFLKQHHTKAQLSSIFNSFLNCSQYIG